MRDIINCIPRGDVAQIRGRRATPRKREREYLASRWKGGLEGSLTDICDLPFTASTCLGILVRSSSTTAIGQFNAQHLKPGSSEEMKMPGRQNEEGRERAGERSKMESLSTSATEGR